MPTTRSTSSRLLKRSALILLCLVALFFLVDDLLMPRYVQQGKTIKVPNVVGLSVEEAIKLLADSGLVGKKSEERLDKQYPIGTIALQNPPPGANVKYGRGVYLTVSGGEPRVLVPSLRGRSLRDAAFALERVGLSLGMIRYEPSSAFPANTIMEQEIPDSTSVVSGTSINVVVSQGPSKEFVPVPSVVTKALTDGERLLLQAGLTIGKVVYQSNSDLLPNTIIEQLPRAGEMVPAGQPVDLVVTRKDDKRQLIEH
jgi:beta-lactam-binding protein with PASTA domain